MNHYLGNRDAAEMAPCSALESGLKQRRQEQHAEQDAAG